MTIPSRELLALPGEAQVSHLANGLTVCRLTNAQAPLVTTALVYRVGARDEPAGQGGIAHFLEHMMFKGSALYPIGAIDRRTQQLGGSNNAFTSHDLTAYYFSFAADRWREALAIEADRMAGLTLEPREVTSERQVICEEIAMYRDEPWDALELAVLAAFFAHHPYGRAVLGTEEELAAIDESALAAFHGRFYRPDNAVLVVAGELDGGALGAVEETLGRVAPGAAARPAPGPPPPRRGLERIERHHGEVPRMMLALPAPAALEPTPAPARLLAGLLGAGRLSRLHRRLVDEGKLCLGASVQLSETEAGGHLTIAAELLPETAPGTVEAALFEELARLAEQGPEPAELERARQVLLADWVFQHERIHQQALTAGLALALFGLDYPERELRVALAAPAEELTALARRLLAPDAGGVLGWSLP